MADFRARRDARRLLKKLAISSSSGTRDHDTRGGTPSSHHSDTLKKKYEELGCLLALQHLENDVLSSVSTLDVRLPSKSRQNNTKSMRKHGRQRHSKILRDVPSSKERHPKVNQTGNGRGRAFVNIPHVFAEDPEVNVIYGEEQEAGRQPTSPQKERLQSATLKPWNSERRPVTRRGQRPSERLEKTSLSSSRSYAWDEHDSVDDRICDVLESEETLFADENDQPLFVIEGQVTVSTYPTSTSASGAKISEVTETSSDSNDECRPESKEGSIPGGSTAKMVTFREPSDEESRKVRSEGEEPSRHDVHHKEEVSPLHIVLEKEILNELLLSPRPGLYRNGEDITEGKQRRRRRMTKERIGYNEGIVTSTLQDPLHRASESSPRGCDHRLDKTDNSAIKLWLRRKNKLGRRQKRQEKQQVRMARLADEEQAQERFEKQLKSEQLVAEWEVNKKREERERTKDRKRTKKVMKKTDAGPVETGPVNTEQRTMQTGPKTGATGKKLSARRKLKKSSRVHPAGGEAVGLELPELQKKVSYEEWLRSKRTDERNANSKQEHDLPAACGDPDSEDIVPTLGKKRSARATRARGRRPRDNGGPARDSDLPESDQRFENPFTLPGPRDDGWVKTLGGDGQRRLMPSRRPPGSVASRDTEANNSAETRQTGRGRDVGLPPSSNTAATATGAAPRTTKLTGCERGARGEMPRNVLYSRYAWDGERIQDSGCETLSSDASNVSLLGAVKDNKVDGEEEGIFLTESIR